MKLALKTVLLLLMFAAVGFSTTVCTSGSTLDQYISGANSPCQFGDVLFSNFTYAYAANADSPLPDAITVNFSGEPGSAGISFVGEWGRISAGGGDNTINDFITFAASISGGVFTDITLNVWAAGNSDSNHNHIDETAGDAHLQVGGFGPTLPPVMVSDYASITPQASLNLAKTIHLAEGNANWGYVTQISQVFGYSMEAPIPVPEPGTFALIGLALASLGLLRKRATRK